MGGYEDEGSGRTKWSKFKIWSTVVNRKTSQTYKYPQGPRTAVMLAYAQYGIHDGDPDSKRLWGRYGNLLVETSDEFRMGDFVVSRKRAPKAAKPKKGKPALKGQLLLL